MQPARSGARTTLRIALGDHPHTAALKNSEIASAASRSIHGVKPVYKVFGAMVRELAFDVSEMAIVTYLQARTMARLWCCCRR